MTAAIKHNAFLLVLCLVLSGLFVSCNKNVVFSEYKKIPEEGWKMEDNLSYDVTIDDNTSYHNVFLTVRHADSYPYSNLYVFLTTTYPSGQKSLDTLECILANPKGEWIGDGAGDIWDVKIPLKQNLRFAKTGKYNFSFEHGMRTNPLPLIMDFGMIIEKVKK